MKSLHLLWFLIHFCVATKLAELLKSFHPCIITVINFSSSTSLDVSFTLCGNPVIHSDGFTKMPSIHPRKTLFCVVYTIISPEDGDISGFREDWVSLILDRVGIRHMSSSSHAFSEFRQRSLYLLESHYLIVATTKDSTNFLLEGYPSSPFVHLGDYLSTVYIVQIGPQTGAVLRVVYICKVCFARSYAAIVLPFNCNFSMCLVTKDFLDSHQDQILARGKYASVYSRGYSEDDRGSFKYELSSTKTHSKISPFDAESYPNNATIGFIRRIGTLLIGFQHNEELPLRLGLLGYELHRHTWTPDDGDSQFAVVYDFAADDPKLQTRINFGEPKTYNFITCDGLHRVGKEGNFIPLLDPLQENVWIATVLGLVLITAIQVAIKFNTNLGHAFLEIFLINFYSILENGPGHSPQNSGLGYVVAGAWMIYLFFVINFHKAVLTSDEMVGSPMTSEYKKILDVVNFSIATPAHNDVELGEDDHIEEFLHTPFAWELAQIVFEYAEHNISVIQALRPLLFDGQNLNTRNHGIHPRDRRVFLKFISNCDKTAAVMNNVEIESCLKYFNQEMGDQVFVKGNDKMVTIKFGWITLPYREIHYGYFYKNLGSLHESGIYQLFHRWHYENTTKIWRDGKDDYTSAKEGVVKPIGFTVQIVWVCYIMGILYGAGLLGLCCEQFYSFMFK